jgi:hypothetical protein
VARQDVRTIDFGLGLTRAHATSPTTSSFPSRVPTTTKPTGAGVFDFRGQRPETPRHVLLIPFGTGNADTVFVLRLIGWRPCGDGRAGTDLWVPTTLAELTCTLGTATGAAGGQVAATEKFADTIAVVVGNANVDVSVSSPADNTAGHALVDLKGSWLVEFVIDVTDATAGNALFAHL